MQVPPDSPVGEDHADDKQERTAATVPRLKTQESCKVIKGWSKGLRKLRTRQSTCALFAGLQCNWLHFNQTISIFFCACGSPVVSKHLLWGYGVVFIKSKSSACLLEHGRNVFGEKMYPFRSTTKSYPCVATDISSELPLNAKAKGRGRGRGRPTGQRSKVEPKEASTSFTWMLPKWQVLLSFGSSRCQKVCLKAGIQDWGSPVPTIDKSRMVSKLILQLLQVFQTMSAAPTLAD